MVGEKWASDCGNSKSDSQRGFLISRNKYGINAPRVSLPRFSFDTEFRYMLSSIP